MHFKSTRTGRCQLEYSCFSILHSWRRTHSARIRSRSRNSAVNSQEFTGRLLFPRISLLLPRDGRENSIKAAPKHPPIDFSLCASCSNNPLYFSINIQFPEWKMEFVKTSLMTECFKLAPLNFHYILGI